MKKYVITFSATSKKLNTTLQSSFELETNAASPYAAGKEAETRVKLYTPMFAKEAEVSFEIVEVKGTKEHTKPRKLKGATTTTATESSEVKA